MKKVLFLITFCVSSLIMFSSCVTFLVASTIKKQSVNSSIKNEISNKGYPIVVTSLETMFPNSAGGVNVEIVFKNISEQKLKYVFFDVVPYNNVDDMVECTVTGKSIRTIQITGPIKIDEKCPAVRTYKNVWWNSTIRRAEIVGIKVTYMDGSTESYDEQQSKEMCKSFYKN